MKEEDIEILRQRYPLSKSTLARNFGVQQSLEKGDSLGLTPAQQSRKGPRHAKRIRQSRDKLNKLEQRWLNKLSCDYPTEKFITQALRFRLGNGIWYKPDVFCWRHTWLESGVMRPTAWEIKGPHHFRGGFENLKVAASLHPEVRFILVWDDGGWNEQEVLP